MFQHSLGTVFHHRLGTCRGAAARPGQNVDALLCCRRPVGVSDLKRTRQNHPHIRHPGSCFRGWYEAAKWPVAQSGLSRKAKTKSSRSPFAPTPTSHTRALYIHKSDVRQKTTKKPPQKMMNQSPTAPHMYSVQSNKKRRETTNGANSFRFAQNVHVILYHCPPLAPAAPRRC